MSNPFSYPLRFEPLERRKVWGVERWLLSALSSCPSIISNGHLKGRGLNEVIPDFPALIKEISAEQWLSVQVHPGEEACKVTGGIPKSEMWCVLSPGPLFAGLKAGSTKQDIKEAVAREDLEKSLVLFNAEVGDVFNIQAGIVHTLGPGIRVFEVQQPSDTTFRLYDWNRIDDFGKKRELHLEQALAAIDLDAPAVRCAASAEARLFRFSDNVFDGKSVIETGSDYLAVYCAEGKMSIAEEPLSIGDVMLVPPEYRTDIDASRARVLTVKVAAKKQKTEFTPNESSGNSAGV